MAAKMLTPEAAQVMGVSLQAIHRKLKYHKLQSCRIANKTYFGFEAAPVVFNLKFNSQTVSFQIVKGGTGKSTLAHNVAVRANLYGARVLCIDLDQQGNLTEAFGYHVDDTPLMVDVLAGEAEIQDTIVNVSPGLDLIPSAIENSVLDQMITDRSFPLDRVYKNKIDSLKDKYDLIILDCPPALGKSVGAAALASDLIIAPVTPERFSLSGLKILTDEYQRLGQIFEKEIKFKVVLNKTDSRTILSKEVIDGLVNHPRFGTHLMTGQVHLSQEFPNATAKKVSIYESGKESQAKQDIDFITREILDVNNQLLRDKRKRFEEESMSLEVEA